MPTKKKQARKKPKAKRPKRVATSDDKHDPEDHLRCFDLAIVYHALLAARVVTVPTAEEPSTWAEWALRKAMSDSGFVYDRRSDPPSAMHSAIGIGKNAKFAKQAVYLREAMSASVSGEEPHDVIERYIPAARRTFLVEDGLVDAETTQPSAEIGDAMINWQASVDNETALLWNDQEARERYRLWQSSEQAGALIVGAAAALTELDDEFHDDDDAIWC